MTAVSGTTVSAAAPCRTSARGLKDSCDTDGDGDSGNTLKDKSCKPMAAYVARLVRHYTGGGHHDDCGHWHPSGLFYNWTGLSVLNEDECAPFPSAASRPDCNGDA